MKNILSCFVIIILLSLSACGRSSEPGSILAEVNGERLDREAFIAGYGIDAWESLRAEERKKHVEDWVNITLLAQAADKAGLSKDPIIRQRMEFAQKKVKANAMIAERLARVRISEDQLFSYFRIHQADFQRPVMSYRIQRINLPDKLSAENLLQQINQGLDFGQAVRRYSTEELRRQDGFMGFVEAASPDSVFWKAVQDLPPMQAGVLTHDGVWYIIRYTESQEGEREANFEDHKEEIRRRILLERQEEIYRNILLEIKSENHQIYYY
jgi:hypothetical protein